MTFDVRDVTLQQGPFARPVKGFVKRDQSTIGEAVELGEKSAVKQSTVGQRCKIGAKSKITGSVLMDEVTVGDK
jgi:NDP-sugar pyrophosphorylase family protein